MGLLTDYSIGSPRPQWRHQLALGTAFYKMYNEVEEQDLIIATEATVTNDWDDLAPDIVIFDHDYNVLADFEVITHNYVRRMKRKCEELMGRFPDAEYFIFDYERNVLYMYAYDSQEWLSSEQDNLYSRFLSQPVLYYFLKTK